MEIKLIAEKREIIFRKNWKEQKLETHKLGGKFEGLWAFSINNSHRIIFEFVEKNVVHFHSVGDHKIYR